MTTWVLIFAIYLNADRSGISLVTHEFSSEKTCMEAGKKMKTEWSRGSFNLVSDLSRWICTPK